MPLSSSTDRAARSWRIGGLAASFVIFSIPAMWPAGESGRSPYVPVTVALAAILILIVITWPRARPLQTFPHRRLAAGSAATAVVAIVLIGIGVHRWMTAVLWHPMDPSRGDMLVVIQAAIRNVLNGRDPYTTYHIPWEAPLPYGPLLWAPFVLPDLAHLDLRLVTVLGEAFVPLCCGAVAIVESGRGRFLAAGTWLTLLVAMLLNPDLLTFSTVGHTPVYWPLLPLFAVFVTAEQWTAAAVTLGLLVTGRTTMVAIMPVFFMAVWNRDRPRMRSAFLWTAIPIVLLMAPFAVWNPWTMWDGMVASYPRVMKGIVWTSPDGGAIHTIGLTGWLLAHQLQRFVEVAQACALTIAYLFAWFALRRGAASLPWMALALLAFSMTTLWPVYYVYFDVLLLFVSSAIAETIALKAKPVRVVAVWAAALALTAIGVATTIVVEAAPFPAINLGSAAQPALYQGFETGTIASTEAAVVWGTEATLVLPRRSTAPADIVLDAFPIIPADSAPQAVTAMLNGIPLGTMPAQRGWQDIRFRPPRSAWRIGANALELRCASSVPPSEVGLGDEPRHLSLAVRRVAVVRHDDQSR